MKRLSVILIGVLFTVGFGGSLQAQAPVSSYKTTVATEETYHSLGSDATVLWEPTVQDTLNRMLLLSSDEKVRLQDGAQYPATVNLGGQMMFGAKKFGTIGIFADGFVFFGSRMKEGDVADSIRPVIDVMFYNLISNHDFLYSAFAYGYGSAAFLLGSSEGTKIGYETKESVLYIGYENVRVKNPTSGKETVLSWNYSFNVGTGEISLQVKDFKFDGGEVSYTFGLASKVVSMTAPEDVLFLTGWDGTTWKTNGSISLPSTGTVDSTYRFNLPATCAEITGFDVNWNQESSVVGDHSISLGSPSWTAGEKVLFVLSEKATLEGDDLPQDGVAYSSDSRIGSSVGLGFGKKGNWGPEVSAVFENLKASTTYYVHAFGYNDSCSGYLYSDGKTQAYTTRISAPEAGTVSLSDVDLNSLKVTLPAAENGISYVVAVSNSPLTDEFGVVYSDMLADGETYTEEQSVSDDFGMYEFTVKKVNATGEVTIENLEESTPYYIAVWAMQGTAQPAYSAQPVVLGERTVARISARIDFENEEIMTQPAGWQISRDGDAYGFEVRYYGEAEDEGIDDGDFPGLLASRPAKAPRTGSKVLVSQLSYIIPMEEDWNAAPQYKDMNAYAITPLFRSGEFAAQAIFKVGVYTKLSDNSPETAFRPKEQDSVVVYWAETGADTWTRLAKLDRNTAWDADGFFTLSTASIKPDTDFHYKVEYFFRGDKEDQAAVMFAIESIEVEEDLPCKYPTELAVVEETIDAKSARLTWEDGNTDVFAESFMLAYRRQDQADWDTVKPNPTNTEHLLENLQPGSTYDVQIQAVCGSAKGNSLLRSISFTTLDTMPYIIDIKNGSTLAIENGRSPLSQGFRSSEEGWSTDQDCAGYPIWKLQLAVYSNTWVKLPVLVSTQDATVRVTTDIFNYKEETGQWAEPERTQDTLFLFVSENGSFAPADRSLVGAIALKDLSFELEDAGDMVYLPQYNSKSLEFEAEAGQKYTLAYYIAGVGADPETEEVNANNLAINKINIEYGNIVYPAVTNLRTENLGKTNVSIVWAGNADSYVVKYKPRKQERYDSVKVTATRADLSGLVAGTAYEYVVYGVYGGVAGKVSDTRYFNTIEECSTPQGFAIVQEFWDGARITAHSENQRLIHLVSAGEVGEYYINQVISWESKRDTLRLRGLSVSGADYPYNIRVRAVCNPGDSSAWTETLQFRTTQLPPVGMPTNLKADYRASTRTAVLSWTPGENNDYMYVYYRKVGEKYDTTLIEGNTYTLMNLETNAVYGWSLQPLHDGYILGGRTEEQSFTAVGNEGRGYAEAIKIRLNHHQIVVENPQNRHIRLIRVYDLTGRVLKTYPVNDNGNVFVNTDLGEGMVIVEVIGSADERASLKAVIM